MTINISGQVPAEQSNGLVDLEKDFLHELAPDPLMAVVIVERASLKFNDVKQEWSATVRFKHIEPLQGEASDEARKLLQDAYSLRTGEAALDLSSLTLADDEDEDDDQ
jgi:hypothetical protein